MKELLSSCIGKRLLFCTYFDSDSDTISNPFVDIAWQICLHFEKDISIYLSWVTSETKVQYVLGASKHNFFERETFEYLSLRQDWLYIVGKKLTNFEIFGKNQAEPYFLILSFENEKIGIANFYYGSNFIPTDENGDYVWIIFDDIFIQEQIIAFNFVLLN